MLAIGRALMAPKVLLLDEPSMGLAPILVEQIFDIISEINEQGTTVLLVEQNALMALAIANRGYVLQTGEVVLADEAAKLARTSGPQGLPRRGLTRSGHGRHRPVAAPRSPFDGCGDEVVELVVIGAPRRHHQAWGDADVAAALAVTGRGPSRPARRLARSASHARTFGAAAGGAGSSPRGAMRLPALEPTDRHGRGRR